jgi:hypothetical protein
VGDETGGEKEISGTLPAMIYPMTLFFGTFILVFAP